MNRCPECFEQWNQESCQHCGFINQPPADDLGVMPPGTLLAQRYLLGNPLGRNIQSVVYIALDEWNQTKVLVEEFYPEPGGARNGDRITIASREPELLAQAIEIFGTAEEKNDRPLKLLNAFAYGQTAIRVYQMDSAMERADQADLLLDAPVRFRDAQGQPLMSVNVLPIPPLPEESAFSPSGAFKRRKKRRFIVTAAVTLLTVALVGGAYFLIQMTGRPVRLSLRMEGLLGREMTWLLTDEEGQAVSMPEIPPGQQSAQAELELHTGPYRLVVQDGETTYEDRVIHLAMQTEIVFSLPSPSPSPTPVPPTPSPSPAPSPTPRPTPLPEDSFVLKSGERLYLASAGETREIESTTETLYPVDLSAVAPYLASLRIESGQAGVDIPAEQMGSILLSEGSYTASVQVKHASGLSRYDAPPFTASAGQAASPVFDIERICYAIDTGGLEPLAADAWVYRQGETLMVDGRPNTSQGPLPEQGRQLIAAMDGGYEPLELFALEIGPGVFGSLTAPGGPLDGGTYSLVREADGRTITGLTLSAQGGLSGVSLRNEPYTLRFTFGEQTVNVLTGLYAGHGQEQPVHALAAGDVLELLGIHGMYGLDGQYFYYGKDGAAVEVPFSASQAQALRTHLGLLDVPGLATDLPERYLTRVSSWSLKKDQVSLPLAAPGQAQLALAPGRYVLLASAGEGKELESDPLSVDDQAVKTGALVAKFDRQELVDKLVWMAEMPVWVLEASWLTQQPLVFFEGESKDGLQADSQNLKAVLERIQTSAGSGEGDTALEMDLLLNPSAPALSMEHGPEAEGRVFLPARFDLPDAQETNHLAWTAHVPFGDEGLPAFSFRLSNQDKQEGAWSFIRAADTGALAVVDVFEQLEALAGQPMPDHFTVVIQQAGLEDIKLVKDPDHPMSGLIVLPRQGTNVILQAGDGMLNATLSVNEEGLMTLGGQEEGVPEVLRQLAGEATPTPTASPTPEVTPTPTAIPTSVVTPTPTVSPTPEVTPMPTATPKLKVTPTPAAPPKLKATPTPTPEDDTMTSTDKNNSDNNSNKGPNENANPNAFRNR